jgi:ribosomal protein S18 acetylase RimI-like enzyme
MRLEPSWTGRAGLLAATGNHPYARYHGGEDLRGYRDEDALIWTDGTVGRGFGDPLRVARLCAKVEGLQRIDLPRVAEGSVADLLPVARQHDWQFRWTRSAPGGRRDESRVVPLGAAHDDDISLVLDEVLAYTGNRPGDPRLRAWYGIFDGGRLAAVGGDRSRHGVGYLAPIAVAARFQGRGYGAAITAAITRKLLPEFGLCALGVMEHNTGAQGFFDRMGYAQGLHRSAIELLL